MSYLPSIALAVAGLLLLLVLLLKLRRVLRVLTHTMSMVATNTRKRTGLLRARSAALHVAIAERRGLENR
ncbi:bacteriophage holin [Amycolatopsis sp. QT-25]|uniref:bacteriophage holin n=1 Tax=Amycolatopsis sp. QT-25 TaxID=3034022 RepID=UPI0023EB403F|nr:bacteriophage holin [Amycolatopsis sp. QT-25]WET82915.1 bacteriophage holin [Amycolatopsis sp. QT-25]